MAPISGATATTKGMITDPLNGNAPFPGNIIPTARISPITLKLQQYYPAANLPGLTSNFSVPVPNTARYNQTVDRIDQNIGDKIRLYARAHYQNWNVFGGNQVPVNSGTTPYETMNYGVGYTHTLTPNLVNDLRVGRNFFTTATLNPFAFKGDTSAGTDLVSPGFIRDSVYQDPGLAGF